MSQPQSPQSLKTPVKGQPLKANMQRPVDSIVSATPEAGPPIGGDGGSAMAAGLIWLDAEDLKDLSKALGRNVQTKTELLNAADRVTGMSVDGVDVYLEPMLLSRLKSRCVHQEWKNFIHEQTIRCLREYAGL